MAKYITQRKHLSIVEKYALRLKKGSSVPYDIETANFTGASALDVITSSISLAQINLMGEIFVLDILELGQMPNFLVDILEDDEYLKIIHNAQFEYCNHRNYKITIKNMHCSMLTDKLFYNGTIKRNDLGSVVYRHVGVKMDKDEQKSDWGIRPLRKKQLMYAGDDVKWLPDVHRSQMSLLEGKYNRLKPIYDLEMAHIPDTGEIKRAGIKLNLNKLELLMSNYEPQFEETKRTIMTMLPPVPLTENEKKVKKNKERFPDGFRPAETLPQIKKAFEIAGIPVPSLHSRKTGKNSSSIGAKTFHLIEHPVGKQLEKQAEVKKLLTSYIYPPLGYKLSQNKRVESGKSWTNPKTGRTHPSVNQIGTVTGRYSYSEPGMQTIPKVPQFREPIEAEKGWLLVRADFSQIELRVAAVIANDPIMLAAFNEDGMDIHSLTAAMVLGVDPKSIEKSDRQKAKAVNFGILFDQSAPGFKEYAKVNYGVDFTLDECKEFKDNWLSTYKRVKRYHTKIKQGAIDAYDRGESYRVYTHLGRVRIWTPDQISVKPGYNGIPYVYANDMINHPIQGTAADGLKIAITHMNEKYRQLELPAKVILTVHDEIIVEVKKDSWKPALKTMIGSMKSCMSHMLGDKVKIGVEASVGKNWAEQKTVYEG